MTIAIVSQPTFKPFLRLNETYFKKMRKNLKKGYSLISRKTIKEQELNQFLLVMASNISEKKFEKMVKGIRKQQERHRTQVRKKIQKQFRRDPELRNSVGVFKTLEKLYNEKFEGTELVEKLSEQSAEQVEKLLKEGEFVFRENTNTRELILHEENVKFEPSEGLNGEEIIDELVLTIFGRNHVNLIGKQVAKMRETLSNVIERIDEFIAEFKEIGTAEKKHQMVELSSVFLGKILGVREPLNLSKKQLSRYISLREEIKEESANPAGMELLQLFDRWFDLTVLESTIKTIDTLENTISKHIDRLRALHSSIEDSIETGNETQITKEFIEFAIKTYGAFEEFRLVTEVFQDIPSFTTLKGGLINEAEDEEIVLEQDTLIYADTVFKSFQLVSNTVYALRGVDLKIKRAEFVAIMGPSGSGKTTLLNVLSGLDKPDRGKVIVDGIDMATAKERTLVNFRRNTSAFIYQSYNLLPVLTSLENVRLPSDFGAKNPIGNKSKRALELLTRVGLERFAKTSPKNLSGGQQQRVTIARSLQNMPKIVFADEPTGDLDHKTGNQIMEILTGINKELGVTLVVVTHDKRVAEMADRIIHMQDGKVIKEEIPIKA